MVVSYTGSHGADLSGSDYRHGELVQRGERGVWAQPLPPGKYAFNTYAGHVVSVPTTNFIDTILDQLSGRQIAEEQVAKSRCALTAAPACA